MKKILPIVDPPIKGYPDFAYMLSVILNYQEGYEWLYCNYIQLIYDEVDLKNSIRFYTPDYNGTTWRPLNTTLCYQLLERNTILDLNINVVDYITYAIDNGFYAMMFVDEFYIPNRWAYKKMPYHHVLFIYGYDKENEMFYTAGYDARMTYTTDLLSFENFVEGFKNDKESIFFENNCIRLMKHDIARYKYKFSPSVVVEQLEEFLYSKDSSLKYGTDFTKQRNVFGIKTYDALIRYLKTTVAYHWEGNLIKPMYTIMEHKKLMADRFRFMVKRGDLKSDTEAVTAYEELHRKWDNLLIKFIYSIKTKKSDSIEKMIPQIVKLKEQEEEVLKKVINEIKENLLVMDENSIYSKVNFFEALRNLDSNVSQVRKLEFDIEAKNKDKEELLIGFDSDNTVMLSEEHLHIKLKLSGKKLKVFDKTEYEEYEFEKETFVEPLHIIISVNYEKQSYSMIGMQNGKEQVKIEDAKFGNPLYPLMTINQYVFCSPPLSLYKMKNLKID